MKKGRPLDQRYIVLEECVFDYPLQQIELFDNMWKEGKSIFEISKKLNRTHTEIACLIMDRCLKDCIEPRPSGLYESIIK